MHCAKRLEKLIDGETWLLIKQGDRIVHVEKLRGASDRRGTRKRNSPGQALGGWAGAKDVMASQTPGESVDPDNKRQSLINCSPCPAPPAPVKKPGAGVWRLPAKGRRCVHRPRHHIHGRAAAACPALTADRIALRFWSVQPPAEPKTNWRLPTGAPFLLKAPCCMMWWRRCGFSLSLAAAKSLAPFSTKGAFSLWRHAGRGQIDGLAEKRRVLA
jgi:hypothetical protein